jgi:WD40 repeat protein
MKKVILLCSLFNFGMLNNDINEEKPRREFHADDKLIAMTFSLNGNLITTANSNSTLSIFHTRMGLKLKTLNTQSPIVAIDASPTQANILACADRSNKITFWDIENGKIQKKFSLKEEIKGIQYRQDGREILVNTSKNAIFYNIVVGKKTQTFKTTNAVLMAYNQSSKLLITTHPDNTVVVWDLEKEKKKFVFTNQTNISHIEINKSGNQLISSSTDKIIKVWDLSSGAELKQIVYDSPFNYVTYDSDENNIISASDDKKTIIWEVSGQTPKPLKTYTGESQAMFVSRHPKEQILLSGYGNKLLQTWLLR